MKLNKSFNGKKPNDSDKLNRKLKLAEHILNHEMEPHKKKAILKFLKGMVELSKRDENLFDSRLAEMMAEHPEMENLGN